jgi:acetyl-CoA carboxylase biotin carboxyl carrier protein
VAKPREATAEPSPSTDDGAGTGDPAPGAGSNAMMDLEFVRGLIEVVDASGIDSIEITRAGTRVKISKTPPAGPAHSFYGMPGPGSAAVPPVPAAPPGGPTAAPSQSSEGGSGGESATGAGAQAAEAEPAASGLVDVTSPMVGTFYRAPAPEAPPYVEVGSRVTRGQTLCILEAMKLMNELESEVDGVVREVLVENAEPVEYGQVLFRIDPTG